MLLLISSLLIGAVTVARPCVANISSREHISQGFNINPFEVGGDIFNPGSLKKDQFWNLVVKLKSSNLLDPGDATPKILEHHPYFRNKSISECKYFSPEVVTRVQEATTRFPTINNIFICNPARPILGALISQGPNTGILLLNPYNSLKFKQCYDDTPGKECMFASRTDVQLVIPTTGVIKDSSYAAGNYILSLLERQVNSPSEPTLPRYQKLGLELASCNRKCISEIILDASKSGISLPPDNILESLPSALIVTSVKAGSVALAVGVATGDLVYSYGDWPTYPLDSIDSLERLLVTDSRVPSVKILKITNTGIQDTTKYLR